jgi:hypothetical protein
VIGELGTHIAARLEKNPFGPARSLAGIMGVPLGCGFQVHYFYLRVRPLPCSTQTRPLHPPFTFGDEDVSEIVTSKSRATR